MGFRVLCWATEWVTPSPTSPLSLAGPADVLFVQSPWLSTVILSAPGVQKAQAAPVAFLGARDDCSQTRCVWAALATCALDRHVQPGFACPCHLGFSPWSSFALPVLAGQALMRGHGLKQVRAGSGWISEEFYLRVVRYWNGLPEGCWSTAAEVWGLQNPPWPCPLAWPGPAGAWFGQRSAERRGFWLGTHPGQ